MYYLSLQNRSTAHATNTGYNVVERDNFLSASFAAELEITREPNLARNFAER